MSAHSKDLNSERLLQLSDEVGRIASTLARLSTDTITAGEPVDAGRMIAEPAPEISVKTVALVLRSRRLRGRYFADELFADPAWDMLLHLLHAELTHQRVAVSSLCAAAAVPATTALRWLKTLADKGLVIRRDDHMDGRRTFVDLAPHTSVALRHYFAQIGEPPTV
jgi:DNA-binding MarR family transcriptional regulator